MLKSNYTYGESQQLFKHVNNLNRNLRLFYATEKVGGHMSFSLFFFFISLFYTMFINDNLGFFQTDSPIFLPNEDI